MTGRSTIAALFVAATVALAACSAPGSPTASGTGAAASEYVTAPTDLPTFAASLPTQTSTSWGRIWDAVPDSFPEPQGAVPASDTGQGAASERLVITAAAKDVADDYDTALNGSGWTVNRDGPLEDGSFTIQATNTGGCKAKVTIASIGDASLVTVLYGTSCPYS